MYFSDMLPAAAVGLKFSSGVMAPKRWYVVDVISKPRLVICVRPGLLSLVRSHRIVGALQVGPKPEQSGRSFKR